MQTSLIEGTCGVVKTAGAIVFDHDNNVLVLRHNKDKGGKIGYPAGKVEPGESYLDCAVRELYEETNIVAESSGMKKLDTLYKKAMRDRNDDYRMKTYTMNVFYCLNDSWSGEVKPSKEGDPEWMSVGKIRGLLEEDCRPNMVNILNECIAYRRESGDITLTV